jgi:hypothetical protein
MSRQQTFWFQAKPEAIDREAGILKGVSMLTAGPVPSYGVYVDQKTLETVLSCALTHADGLKVKMEHDGDVDDIVGALINFRIDGGHLRADLQLLKESGSFDQIIEMAEKIPSEFGLSISFSGDREEIELLGLPMLAMRCREIYSCDIVENPAANPGGLFSMPTNPNPNPEPLTLERIISQLSELKTAQTQLVTELATKADITALQAEIANLRSEHINAETIAVRRLGAMGVPFNQTLPPDAPGLANPPPPPAPKTLSQQLEEIKGHRERQAFFIKHKAELYAETQAAQSRLMDGGN